MGQIKTRWFYTELVEHYLRMAVRYETVSKASSQHWFDITKDWIANLSDKDKQFIRFVFDEKFYNTTEGLACFEPSEDYDVKRKRLYDIERRFAIDGGLIDDTDWLTPSNYHTITI